MNKSEELCKQTIKVQQIKTKLNSKILAYISKSTYAPKLEQTKEYVRTMASKMLKDINPMLLHEIVNYAYDLQNFYYANISFEYLLQEYVQEKQKERNNERKTKS